MKNNKFGQWLWIRLAPLLGGLLGIALALFLVTMMWVSAPVTPAKAACDDGYLYAVARVGGEGQSGAIYRIDSAGNHTLILNDMTFQSDAVARHPTQCNLLYILDNFKYLERKKSDFYTLYVYDLNDPNTPPQPVNGQIGNTGIPRGTSVLTNFDRLAFSHDGNLYGLQVNQFYQFNLETGKATAGKTITWPAGHEHRGGDIAFDTNGVLWLVNSYWLYQLNGFQTTEADSIQAHMVCEPATNPQTGLGVRSGGYLMVFEYGNSTGTTGNKVNVLWPTDANKDGIFDDCEVNPTKAGPFPVIYGATPQISDMSSSHSDEPTSIFLNDINARRVGGVPFPILAGIVVSVLGGSAFFLRRRVG